MVVAALYYTYMVLAQTVVMTQLQLEVLQLHMCDHFCVLAITHIIYVYTCIHGLILHEYTQCIVSEYLVPMYVQVPQIM